MLFSKAMFAFNRTFATEIDVLQPSCTCERRPGRRVCVVCVLIDMSLTLCHDLVYIN